MIEAYIVTLLGLNLIGHTRDAMHEKSMLEEFQTPLIESVANEHPLNTEGESGKLSIALSDNHRKWILSYYYPGEDREESILSSAELASDSTLKPREGTLQDYKASLEEQRQTLIDAAKTQLEENNRLGKLPRVGFGAGEILAQALYTDENLKWRVNGRSWTAPVDEFSVNANKAQIAANNETNVDPSTVVANASQEYKVLQALGWIDKA
jgi:hypothetical protein